jgi:hypothetical protein
VRNHPKVAKSGVTRSDVRPRRIPTSPTTVSLEIDTQHESLARDYAAYLDEIQALAATASEGSVLSTCEEAVGKRGRDQLRRGLEQVVQARIDDAEKKGRR